MMHYNSEPATCLRPHRLPILLTLTRLPPVFNGITAIPSDWATAAPKTLEIFYRV
jgi:hypothetical protein